MSQPILSLSISPRNTLTSQTLTVTSTVSPASAKEYEGYSRFYYAPFNNLGATIYPSYTISGATFTTTLPKLAAGQYYLGANWIGLEGCAQSCSNELIFTVAQASGTGGAALHGQYAVELKGVSTHPPSPIKALRLLAALPQMAKATLRRECRTSTRPQIPLSSCPSPVPTR